MPDPTQSEMWEHEKEDALFGQVDEKEKEEEKKEEKKEPEKE